MRLECVEAFADATVRVLSSALGEDFGRGEPRLAGVEERRAGVTVHVPCSGAIEGRVALTLDAPTALRLYNRVTGEEQESLPDMAVDYFLELGNVICGSAVSALNELGFAVRVHPPRLVAAAPTTDTVVEAECCQIPVYSPQGAILVQVVLSVP